MSAADFRAQVLAELKSEEQRIQSAADQQKAAIEQSCQAQIVRARIAARDKINLWLKNKNSVGGG